MSDAQTAAMLDRKFREGQGKNLRETRSRTIMEGASGRLTDEAS